MKSVPKYVWVLRGYGLYQCLAVGGHAITGANLSFVFQVLCLFVTGYALNVDYKNKGLQPALFLLLIFQMIALFVAPPWVYILVIEWIISILAPLSAIALYYNRDMTSTSSGADMTSTSSDTE